MSHLITKSYFPMKVNLSNFQDPSPPVHLCLKYFHPLDLGRPILNESPPASPSPVNYGTTTALCM